VNEIHLSNMYKQGPWLRFNLVYEFTTSLEYLNTQTKLTLRKHRLFDTIIVSNENMFVQILRPSFSISIRYQQDKNEHTDKRNIVYLLCICNIHTMIYLYYHIYKLFDLMKNLLFIFKDKKL